MSTNVESQTDGAKPSDETQQSTDNLHDSIRGTRKNFSSHLYPLQVKSATPGGSATSGTTTAAQGARDILPSTSNPQQQQQPPLSLESESVITSKIHQLSQLPSFQLRELARRLGEEYKILTPKYAKPAIRLPYADFQVGPRWEEIQGSKRWAGMLDPIDPVLRAELVRYGEFNQATYDAFDADTSSRFAGSSKYTKDVLFERVGLDNRGYEITDFLYATADIDLPSFFTRSLEQDTWSKESNWMGYVAVCTSPEELARLGRRDILVAWRGSITEYEWIEDVQDYLAPAGFDPREGDSNVMVESGFLSVYKSSNEKSRYNKTSAREQVLGAVKRLVEKYNGEAKLSITVVGHSLGSALATICGYDIAESKINLLSATAPVPNEWNSQTFDSGNGDQNDRIPVTVFSHGGPHVGNKGFKDRLEALGVAVLRVVNVKDVVPKTPGLLFQKELGVLQNFIRFLPAYEHVGELLEVDYASSNYFKETTDLGNFHNLEAYMHLVDGYHGTGLPFKLTTRDFALANRGADLLKHEYYIPASWWQEAYKGLVRDKDGHWVVPPRGIEVFPATPVQSSTRKVKEHADFYRAVSIALQNAIKTLGIKDPEGVLVATLPAAGQGQAAAPSIPLQDAVVDVPDELAKKKAHIDHDTTTRSSPKSSFATLLGLEFPKMR